MQQEQQPKGALTIVLIFMLTLIILWSYVFLTLMERGVTR